MSDLIEIPLHHTTTDPKPSIVLADVDLIGKSLVLECGVFPLDCGWRSRTPAAGR